MCLEEDKLRHEMAKLVAETKEIENRIASAESFWGRSRDRIAYFTALVVLIAGAIGLYRTTDSYFRQRQVDIEQRQKAYDFNVNKEIILLSKQLGSDSPVERTSAAYLLSAFEEDAVPILVANLRVTDKGDLPRHLISALDRIVRKEKLKDRVTSIMTYVAQEAEAFVDSEAKKRNYSVKTLKNYVSALGELGARSPTAAGESLDRIGKKLSAPESRISSTDRTTLAGAISAAKARIAAETRP